MILSRNKYKKRNGCYCGQYSIIRNLL